MRVLDFDGNLGTSFSTAVDAHGARHVGPGLRWQRTRGSAGRQLCLITSFPMCLLPELPAAQFYGVPETVILQRQPESGPVWNADQAVLHSIAGAVQAGRRGIVPLHVGEKSCCRGEMAGDVVSKVRAVVVRRGSDAPLIQLSAEGGPACQAI